MLLNRKYSLIIFFTGFIAADSVIACSCGDEIYRVQIAETKALVVHEAKLVDAHGLLKGAQRYACSLVSFQVSDAGVAVGSEIVKSAPAGVMDRTAIKTLERYQFDALRSEKDKTYYLLFETKL